MQEDRRWVIQILFIVVGLIFLVKLFFIQVVDEELKLEANDNSIKRRVIYPHRGVILDRKGKVLVGNTPIYDIMVLPREVEIEDTLKFCQTFGLSREEFEEKMQKAKEYSSNKPSAFIKQLSKINFARVQDRLVDYPGFYAQSRTIRTYPHRSAAHLLGYIGEISESKLKADTTGYYQLGDYVGRRGVEAAYEKELRGRKGIAHYWEDAKGNWRGKYKKGVFDSSKVDGKMLYSSIDLELQQYGEYLMKNKKGAIVAIEPATGEILSMVSAPSYDPNELAGENFRSNYGNLELNEHKPLFNRAVRAQYPPGSTFKTIQALIAQQENMVDAQTVFACNKSLVKCHWHPTTDLQRSIQHSCNPYYYRVFRRIVYQNRISRKDSAYTLEKDQDLREGFDMWRSYLDQFNLGRKTGVDLVSEINGLVPQTSLYDRRYGAENWAYSNIYSLSIGQGEIGVLPVQLANVAAIIANRGFYYTPHLIRGIGQENQKRPAYTIKKQVPIDKKNFDLVISGMRDAYRNGTVAYFAVVDSLEICGKTGTAQNPHGEDHSVFIAFAPKDNPKIAISVHVENAGFGGAWAAPIAALMIERYLKGRTSKKMEITEKIVMGTKFIEEEDRPIFPEDENKIPEKPKDNLKPEEVLAIGQ